MKGRRYILAMAMVLAVAGIGRIGAADVNHKSQSLVRVLLVTGGHEHELSFYEMFAAQNGLTVAVNPHPHAFRQGMARQTDVLVLYDLADVTDEAERSHLKEFVESGKGVVVLHNAIADNQSWPWWYEEVVGGRYLLAATIDHPASKYKHDVDFKVRPVMHHPILDGIEPFQINDEAYKDQSISPKVRVLLETDNPLNDKPMAWISPYPKSRVVYIQLGHGPSAHRNVMYRKLVHNAIMWAAGKTE